MIRLTINLCVWCGTPHHAISVVGAEQVPPGEHPALVQISHGMCKAAEEKWREAAGLPVTHPVTPPTSNREGVQG